MDKFNKAYNRILHLISEDPENPVDAYDEQKFMEKDNANKWLRANDRIEKLLQSCSEKEFSYRCPSCHKVFKRNSIDTSSIKLSSDKQQVYKKYLSTLDEDEKEKMKRSLCDDCYEKNKDTIANQKINDSIVDRISSDDDSDYEM